MKWLGLLFFVVSCGGSQQSTLEGVDKISSMQLKENGFFDVICADGSREVISAKDLNRDNVCAFKAAQPMEGEIFAPADSVSKYSGCSVASVATFGNEAGTLAYDGFASFTLTANGGYSSGSVTTEVTDGYGAKWTNTAIYLSTSVTRFHRLKLPVGVAITSNNCSSASNPSTVEVSNKSIYQNAVSEIKYAGDMIKNLSIATLAPSLENAVINIDVNLKLFNNFTAGTDCGRISFMGKNKTVEITNQNPSTVVAGLVAPVIVFKYPICQTSRLPTPENSRLDYELTLKVLFVDKK